MKNNTTFETGATSAAVNELILYTDNTSELAEFRDQIYEAYNSDNDAPNVIQMMPLLSEVERTYKKEFGKWPQTTSKEDEQYCQIYANRFADWKKEKELLQAKQK